MTMIGKIGAASALAIASMVLGSSPAAAQTQLRHVPAPADPAAAASWRTLTERDLDALREVIRHNYIYAYYPGGPAWTALEQRTYDRAREDAVLVKSQGGYRAVIERFIGGFDDAHFSAYFRTLPTFARWPGFSVRYRGGRYLVAASTLPEVKPGDELVQCDGRDLNSWVDGLVGYYGGVRGRETTRASLAAQLMVDLDNPLVKRPQACRIGARDVTLRWSETAIGPNQPLPYPPERTATSVPTVQDMSASITAFGDKGAWVRMGTMIPTGDSQVGQFEKLIADAPSLRDKDVVVIDVRGNAGGIYNWFMAFLRGLYGPAYADYYARARLEIASVSVASPPPPGAAPGSGANPGIAGFDMSRIPADPPMDVKTGTPQTRPLAGGLSLVTTAAPAAFTKFPARPPQSLAHGKVYLLTDYGCGSACISFVDEMMRFPGVTLIGAETHLDRRSGGWPLGYELPSGLTVVRMGRMTREGRRRGENEAWVPAEANRFRGDITDTEAVKRWIREEILPRDAKGGKPAAAVLKGPE
ncbi:MAG: hypothetical protein ACTHLU_07640 [Novosphingobium sp.]